MIRSYTVSQLEQMSGTTRRTISDYIAKGVLTGPSHRGRGARYSQKDLDVLTVLPRLRTLMKKEYPTLKEISAFINQLSVRDIHTLASLSSEESFVSEMRRLRVRNSLMGLLPYMPPERIEEALAKLTPGQVRGIDAGRYQIGAVLDIESLLQEESDEAAPANGSRFSGERHEAPAESSPSWSVSWLNGHQEGDGDQGLLHPEQMRSIEETTRRLEQKMLDTTTDLDALVARSEETQPNLPVVEAKTPTTRSVEARLVDIASRLEKLETMFEKA